MIVEYQNRLAVPASILYDDLKVVDYQNYLTMVRRHKLTKLRAGKGKDNCALIALDSLKPEWRTKIISLYPRPEQVAETNAFNEFIVEDTEAIAYFTQIQKTQPRMEAKHVTRHSNEAAILNGFRKKYEGILKYSSRGATTRGFWKKAVSVLEGLNQHWPHKLPSSEKRLKDKYERYLEYGYKSLLKGWDNANSRVVNEEIEALLNSIYCRYFKPNPVQVLKDYNLFLEGKIDIVSGKTGEIYDRAAYEPVSESTVRNYLMKWENQVVTHSKRSNNRLQFGQKNRAYASLTVDYSGSILSLDDRDLPWKMHNGKRVVAYLAADACSECFVGWAFSKPATRENDTVHGKNVNLIYKMYQNLFQQLDFYGVNMPAEVEVENHLMRSLENEVMKEGNLFRYIRWAAPENPQEKHIEGFFRRIRYDFDKRQNDGKGWLPRPFARNEANQNRLEDSEKYTYSFEEICQMAIDSMMQWNEAPHPDQKKFPGKSRLDVWLDNQHPELLPIDWRNVARWVGNKTETSVSRYELRCNNQIWRLPSPELANKTGNSGRALDAYWLPNNAGTIERIYLYEKDTEKYICEALPKEIAHKARIEQTDADKNILGKNYRYNKGIEAHIREGKEQIDNVVVISTTATNNIPQQVEIIPDTETEFDYYKIERNNQPPSLLDEL